MKSTKKLQEEREALIAKREKKKEEYKIFSQDINQKIKDKEDEIKKSFAEKIIKNLQIKDFNQFADAEREISKKIGEINNLEENKNEIGEENEEGY
ncbi:MAG: hypothetical protein E7G36_00510 [Peptoniphilus rhinitidis]|uniref:hypothetical protein n=1 Tax=Peptoniphilus rhinitidis TaxID=1175452 RepID=UPI002900D580|nr:hypothetical protein [Peptoniphilus rhinitidis]MDU2109531.1 hypothetical protein [Peptoniphilus lacydonensis]MDU3750186.1 hypothetical protein [Peptoniphilus rhinitidis]